MTTLLGADLAPQRPLSVREKADRPGHVLEPEWTGTRALVRVGHEPPYFVGYRGPVDAPRELYEAIVADAHCDTAILDGVIVSDWQEERELEADSEGNAFTRQTPSHPIFAAFDLLEVDGESFLDVPLLERKRHLEGLLKPSVNVRLTVFQTRGLRAWRETLAAQGFRRVVLKDGNSAYAPGQTNGTWIVVEKLGGRT